MRQPPVLRIDLFPLAGLRREFVQFGELPGEALAFQLQLTVTRLRMLDRLNPLAPCAPCPRDGGRRVGQSGVSVEQFALRVRAHQQLVRVLAVNIHQHLADLAQLRERRRGAVDERPREAVAIHHAPQHHGAAVMTVAARRAERLLVEPLLDLRMGLEFRRDVRAAFTGAHHVRIGTGAERERQRVDQDRLAGAGFAGENSEAAVEFEIERGDDDEVAYREVAKHGGRLMSLVVRVRQRRRSRSGGLAAQGLGSSSCDGYSFQCSFLRSVAK